MSNSYNFRPPQFNLPEMAGRELYGAGSELNNRVQEAMPDLNWTAIDSLKLAFDAGASASLTAAKIPNDEKKEVAEAVLREAKAIGAKVAHKLQTVISTAAQKEGMIGDMFRDPDYAATVPESERVKIMQDTIRSVTVSDQAINNLNNQLTRLGRAFVIGGIVIGAVEFFMAEDKMLEAGQQLIPAITGFLVGNAAVGILASAGAISAGSIIAPAVITLLVGVGVGFVVEKIYNAITGYDG